MLCSGLIPVNVIISLRHKTANLDQKFSWELFCQIIVSDKNILTHDDFAITFCQLFCEIRFFCDIDIQQGLAVSGGRDVT